MTNTNDNGAGSLRQAIIDSNADSGDRDTIVFDIPGGGVHTITPLTALPVISQPVVIDGTTQPGYAGGPLIELNGNGLAGAGLFISGGNSIVRGLVINRFGGAGILVQTNGGNVIAGNYIGVDALATTARGNGGHGVQIDGAPGNTVGGVEPAARNVISGNLQNGVSISGAAATGNLVASNFIGTNGSGMSAIANSFNGVVIATRPATPSAARAGNVISGNSQNGIAMLGGVVFGEPGLPNKIGVNALSTMRSPIFRTASGSTVRVHDHRWRRPGAQHHRRQRPARHRHLWQHGRYGGLQERRSSATRIGFRSPPNTVGNGLSGMHLGVATNTIIGGDTQDATNLISQNGRNGVTVLSGTGNHDQRQQQHRQQRDPGHRSRQQRRHSERRRGRRCGPEQPAELPGADGDVRRACTGTLNSLASSPYTIQFFGNSACDASGNGEGETFLGR